MEEILFNQKIEAIEAELMSKGIEIIGKKPIEYGIRLLVRDINLIEEIIQLYNSGTQITVNYNRQNVIINEAITNAIANHQNYLSYPNSKYIGIDESGKGDYLGPLVIGGFTSDKNIDKRLIKLGVKDCKKLNDKQVTKIAKELKENFPSNYTLVLFEPIKYNEEYSILRLEGGNMTDIIRRGQEETIIRLFERDREINVIIADSIESRELQGFNRILRGHTISYYQEINAERNPAVAAAGILARDYFLNWLEERSAYYKINLQKGSNEKTILSAIEIISNTNKDELKKIAKLHFKTTQKLMKELVLRGL